MPLSRGWIRSIERRARHRLDSFALLDGTRHYFDPGRACASVFVFAYNAQLGERAVVPDILRAVCEAHDVGAALAKVADEETLGAAVDLEALLEERRIVVLEHTPAEDLSELPAQGA